MGIGAAWLRDFESTLGTTLRDFLFLAGLIFMIGANAPESESYCALVMLP